MALIENIKIDRRLKQYKAAKQLNITEKEYLEKVNSGLKLCSACSTWKSTNEFHFENAKNNIRHPSCKVCVSLKSKKLYRNKTPKRVFYQYQSNAKNRGYLFELTIKDFELLKDETCFYCFSSKDLGYDRINNQLGYIKDNIVPCCWLCNHMKYQSSTEEWFGHMIRILKSHGYNITRSVNS